jgi:hypothetical protein
MTDSSEVRLVRLDALIGDEYAYLLTASAGPAWAHARIEGDTR